MSPKKKETIVTTFGKTISIDVILEGNSAESCLIFPFFYQLQNIFLVKVLKSLQEDPGPQLVEETERLRPNIITKYDFMVRC